MQTISQKFIVCINGMFWGGITLYWTTASKYTSSVNTQSKEFVPLSVVKNIFSVVNREIRKKNQTNKQTNKIEKLTSKDSPTSVETESSLLQCEEKKGVS